MFQEEGLDIRYKMLNRNANMNLKEVYHLRNQVLWLGLYATSPIISCSSVLLCAAEEVVHCPAPERVIHIAYDLNNILWSWEAFRYLAPPITNAGKGSEDMRLVQERSNG